MKLKFYAFLILAAALYAAYFFIRHSFIIVSLAPVLGVIMLVAVLAGAVMFLRRKS